MADLEKELGELLRASAEQAVGKEIDRAIGPLASRATGAPIVEALAASNSAKSGSAGESTTRSVVNAVLDGMGLSPILRGLLSLFGGGGSDEPPAPLPRYAAPPPVRVSAGIRRDSGAPFALDYGQGGEAREIASAAPQVVVNVSAMDTQSFLDRSDDIAQAVKRALLESHSLNDVIAEL